MSTLKPLKKLYNQTVLGKFLNLAKNVQYAIRHEIAAKIEDNLYAAFQFTYLAEHLVKYSYF